MSEICVRRIERFFGDFPRREVVGICYKRNAFAVDGVFVLYSARKQHAVFFLVFVIEHERVAEIVHFQPFGCFEHKILVLFPIDKVFARRAQNFLLGQTFRAKVRIVSGVENVIGVAVFYTATRKHVKVLLFLRTAKENGAVVFIIDKVAGGQKTPRTTLAVVFDVAVIPQIKQFEFSVFVERYHVCANCFSGCSVKHYQFPPISNEWFSKVVFSICKRLHILLLVLYTIVYILSIHFLHFNTRVNL